MKDRLLPVEALKDPLPLPLVAFFDIDGTLIGHDGVLATSTINSIRLLAERGCRVGLATGRSLFGAMRVVEQLALTGPSVFFAGALVIDTSRRHIISERALPSTGLSRILAWAKEKGRYIEWYTRESYYIETDHPLAALHAQYLSFEPVRKPFSELDPEHCIKLELISTTPQEEREVRDFMSDIEGIDITFARGPQHPDFHFINLVSSAASRERIFDELLQYFQVSPSEVACFGDSDGDLSFVSRAGIGVAMKNATPRLKKHARFLAPHCENGGISQALKYLFGIKV